MISPFTNTVYRDIADRHITCDVDRIVHGSRQRDLNASFEHLSTIGRECWIEPGFQFVDGPDDVPPLNTFGVNRLLAMVQVSFADLQAIHVDRL